MRTTLYVQWPQLSAPLIAMADPVKLSDAEAIEADVW